LFRASAPWNLSSRPVLRVSLLLAAAVLVLQLVSPREVPALLDLKLLEMFVVLIVAVECARRSGLFDWLVARILERVRSERALAFSAVLLTGALSALLTNDVALLLVVPFTLAFERTGPDGFDPVRIVVLEISAANLAGALLPTGNPQNLFLFTRAGLSPVAFLAAQLPWVGVMTAALLLAVPLLVPARALPAPPGTAIRVRKRLALGGKLLLTLQVFAVLGLVPRAAPLLAAVPVALLLGRDLLSADFSLVAVFSALFVVVEGLRRSPLYALVDPIRRFGTSPEGFVVSGALLSQVVSNVPAAILLAPSAAGAAAFTGLLYGVNAGGCGTPIASIANLIGADLYVRARKGHARRFWTLFLPVSFGLLALAIALSIALLSAGP